MEKELELPYEYLEELIQRQRKDACIVKEDRNAVIGDGNNCRKVWTRREREMKKDRNWFAFEVTFQWLVETRGLIIIKQKIYLVTPGQRRFQIDYVLTSFFGAFVFLCIPSFFILFYVQFCLLPSIFHFYYYYCYFPC